MKKYPKEEKGSFKFINKKEERLKKNLTNLCDLLTFNKLGCICKIIIH